MSESAALKAIRRAGRRRDRAEQARREAMVELREWCAKAHAEGVSITQIARESGLSRQGVYDLLGDRRPS
jgi:hypothetical protein